VRENIGHLEAVMGEQVVQSLFTSVATGEGITERMYGDIASRLGQEAGQAVEPGHVKEVIAKSMQHYFDAGRAAISREGVPAADADNFTAWALAQHRGPWMDACDGVRQGDMRAIRQLARDFVKHGAGVKDDSEFHGRSVSAPEGSRVYIADDKRTVMIDIPGKGTTPLRAAISAGLVQLDD